MTFRQTVFRDLKLPLLSILIIGAAGVLFLPVLPIDETRYLSVAWEMHNSHSWLVPMLNGLPYSHKPPLFFWIIQAIWKLFGMHDATPRLVSITSSLISILLLYKISLRIWPKDRKVAAYAALILGSTGIWLVWSTAIMFDILLTTWVLLAILGILRLSNSARGGWILLTLGITGGILTKGPVVLLYILPLTLSGRFWISDLPKKWHWKTGSAFLTAIALALLWAVPASIIGGATYREAIFWKQSAGRITESFAHRRPFWWYLPIIPLVFFPWSLFLFSLPKSRFRLKEKNLRPLLIWLTVPIVLLSLISGKQVHYLIPILPAGALLTAHMIIQTNDLKKIGVRLIGLIYLLAGLAGFALPLIRLGADVGRLKTGSTLLAAIGFTIVGIFLLVAKFKSSAEIIRSIALSTVVALLSVLCGAKTTLMEEYNIKRMAGFIKEQMDAGQTVAHIGKYHGQYQFLGRLPRPLPVISHDPTTLNNFIIENPNTILISYFRDDNAPANATELYSQSYRGKTVIAWRPAGPPPNGKEPHENSAD